MTRHHGIPALGGLLLGFTCWAGCGGGGSSGPDCEPVAERCNELDDDCDGVTDEDFALGDPCTGGVGACQATGVLRCSADGTGVVCDAAPGAPGDESCNQLDDDCDGSTDEGVASCCQPASQQGCGVELGVCTTGLQTCGASGAWGPCLSGGAPVIAPGDQGETCDGLDNDCDGSTDEDYSLGLACNAGVGACARTGQTTCAPTGDGVVCDAVPGAPALEACNGIDDDCDGNTDESLAGASCALQMGVCAGSVQVCGGASGWLTCGAAQYGGAYQANELSCDGLDNDCDGSTDEGLLVTRYVDGDEDTYGAGAASVGCLTAGYSAVPGDCNDSSAAVSPAASEACGNSVDDDCDGITDEAGCVSP